MPRVIAYIDGFNLYFGMKSVYGHQYTWLNVEGVSNTITTAPDVLVATKYFTSRVTNDPPKEKRQKTYLEALSAATGTQILYGRYQVITGGIVCRSCHASWDSVREKMTDVQIATHMLADAFTNQFDKAILITGDTDLVPTIRMIKAHLPYKEIIVAFPPNRSRQAKELKTSADSYFTIEEADLMANQLLDPVAKPGGHLLNKPIEWH